MDNQHEKKRCDIMKELFEFEEVLSNFETKVKKERHHHGSCEEEEDKKEKQEEEDRRSERNHMGPQPRVVTEESDRPRSWASAPSQGVDVTAHPTHVFQRLGMTGNVRAVDLFFPVRGV